MNIKYNQRVTSLGLNLDELIAKHSSACNSPASSRKISLTLIPNFKDAHRESTSMLIDGNIYRGIKRRIVKTIKMPQKNSIFVQGKTTGHSYTPDMYTRKFVSRRRMPVTILPSVKKETYRPNKTINITRRYF